MTYSWEILELYTEDVTNSEDVVLQDAVCQIVWRKTLTTEDGDKSSYLSTTSVSAAETLQADFVEYASLTPGMLIEWAQSWHTESDTDMINKILIKRLNNTREEKAIPWL